jgi:hypothetical protein
MRARYNIDRGAQVIDINMGCPAKKVCNVRAGSALMSDEPLALRIVEAVVAACAAARRAGDAEDAHRPAATAERNALALAARGASRRRGDGHRARPHARAGLRRRWPSTTPSPPSRRRCASRWWPTATSTRPPRRARVLRAHRRRRA